MVGKHKAGKYDTVYEIKDPRTGKAYYIDSASGKQVKLTEKVARKNNVKSGLLIPNSTNNGTIDLADMSGHVVKSNVFNAKVAASQETETAPPPAAQEKPKQLAVPGAMTKPYKGTLTFEEPAKDQTHPTAGHEPVAKEPIETDENEYEYSYESYEEEVQVAPVVAKKEELSYEEDEKSESYSNTYSIIDPGTKLEEKPKIGDKSQNESLAKEEKEELEVLKDKNVDFARSTLSPTPAYMVGTRVYPNPSSMESIASPMNYNGDGDLMISTSMPDDTQIRGKRKMELSMYNEINDGALSNSLLLDERHLYAVPRSVTIDEKSTRRTEEPLLTVEYMKVKNSLEEYTRQLKETNSEIAELEKRLKKLETDEMLLQGLVYVLRNSNYVWDGSEEGIYWD